VVTEITLPRPANIYEATKTASDEIVMQSCAREPLSYSILRPSNVFGATMTNQSLRRLLGMVRKGRFFYLGPPGAIATYVHVDDVVNAMILLASHQGAVNQVYNLSSDCTFEALIEVAAAAMGVKAPTLRLPAAPVLLPLSISRVVFGGLVRLPQLDTLVRRTNYCSRKIQDQLGFEFTRPLPGSIADLVA
jgi:nucleoside-diphosphate-sugar epimerase